MTTASNPEGLSWGCGADVSGLHRSATVIGGKDEMTKVFTFWEGPMPAYIRLCMQTWPFKFEILNFSNLHQYTDLQADDRLKRFSLPQIADCVRVHVLRDQGGYWLDADTIMVTDKLPVETIMGNSQTRANTIGYLYAHKAHMPMFDEWAAYQDKVLEDPHASLNWDVMGNAFTDKYLKEHPEVTIAPIDPCWPEVYMVDENINRKDKYQKFYFDRRCNLTDLRPTDMIMLHNSWTPGWYKKLGTIEVLTNGCTLSNILVELIS